MAMKKTAELIEIAPIEIVKANIRIVGTSPLIMHTWSAKAKRQIIEKEMGTTKTKPKDDKRPVEEFASSMYWLTPMPEELTEEAVNAAIANGARFGFPVTAFKQAAISAAFRMGWVKDKMSMRGAFFIEQDQDGYYAGDIRIDHSRKKVETIPNVYRAESMVEIHSDPPILREDMVRVGMGSADIRYRGEFKNWYADLTVNYNTNGQYSLEQILNVINAGGFVCGVGEWRPEKDGQYGMYKIVV